MDENTATSNISTIKEMLLDEDKLVTYVSLSKELCIHVNESKFLLNKISQDLKSRTDFNINYIISGLSEDNKARTMVCTEGDLKTQRERLRIVFFEHIYSIGKGSAAVDNVAFLAINKFEDFPLCTGLIKSNLCVKRTSSELGDLKTISQESVKTELNKIPPKKLKEESKPSSSNGLSKSSRTAKVQECKSEPAIKSENISPKKDPPSTNNKQKSKPVSQKGIAGFFSKSNSMPAKEIKKEINLQSSTKEISKPQNGTKSNSSENNKGNGFKEICKPQKGSISKDIKEEKMDVDEVIEKPSKEKNDSKTKSLEKIKTTAKVDKKRKRVLHVSDSESEPDDLFVDDEPTVKPEIDSEDEIPPTPSVNTVKITSGIVNPKKRRKVVDKTYTDDEGYILTKKVEVYQSCSEEEAEVNTKENTKVNHVKVQTSPKEKSTAKTSKKKISPPQKGKQATMMSFFKKV